VSAWWLLVLSPVGVVVLIKCFEQVEKGLARLFDEPDETYDRRLYRRQQKWDRAAGRRRYRRR